MKAFFLRIIVILGVGVPLHVPVYGQVGVKAGASLQGLVFSPDDALPFLGYEINILERGPFWNFHVGIFKRWALSKRFDVQSELLYSVRGLTANRTFLYETIDYDVRIKYVEIPVLVKAKMALSSRFEPSLYAGGYSAIKMSARSEKKILNETDESELSHVKNFDYGLLFGADTDLNVWSQKLFVDLRFNWGLANVMSKQKNTVRVFGTDPGAVRNAGATLTTGFIF